jgi:hypothetical protein
MYARFFVTRYGKFAVTRAKAHVKRLAKKGDLEGEKIWQEVVVEIEKQRKRGLPKK